MKNINHTYKKQVLKHENKRIYLLPKRILSLLPVVCLFFCSINASLTTRCIDVGQGNCTLVTHPDCLPLLVDCGSLAHEYRGDQFKNEQLDTLASNISLCGDQFALVVSHPDADHYKWIPDLLRKTYRKRVRLACAWLGGSEHHYGKKMIDALKNELRKDYSQKTFFPTSQHHTTTSIDLVGAVPNLSIQILPALTCKNKAKEANAASLVVLITFFGERILLTGDATYKTMEHIFTYVPPFTVLLMQASHHGAEPGKEEKCNDPQWITQLAPKAVVFSSGIHKGFLHPRETTCQSYMQTVETSNEWRVVYVGSMRDTDEMTPHILAVAGNYEALITQKNILSTLAQGTITFSLQFDSSNQKNVHTLSAGSMSDSFKKTVAELLALGRYQPFDCNDIVKLNISSLNLNDTGHEDYTILKGLLTTLHGSKKSLLRSFELQGVHIETHDILDLLKELAKKTSLKYLSLCFSNSLSKNDAAEFSRIWNNRGLYVYPLSGLLN